MREYPDFDALLLDSQKFKCVGQVDLGQLAAVVTTSDCHLASRLVVEWICQSCLRCLTLKHAYTEASLLQLQIIMADQANRLRAIEVPDRSPVTPTHIRGTRLKHDEGASLFVEDDLEEFERLVGLVVNARWHVLCL